MSTRNMIITTTSTLQGWEIEEYLGPISSHVVAGTNIFSDTLADLSDIFGGRSESYQKQLTSIHEESIHLLEKKAKSLNANCILGLRIDHDEISGKGKSMFMVTSVGTAVKIRVIEGYKRSTGNSLDNIDFEEMSILLKKRKIYEDCQNKTIDFTDEIWEFIISNNVQKIYPFILKRLYFLYYECNISENYKKFKRMTKGYLLNLPRSNTKEILYETILNNNYNDFSFIKDIMNVGKFLEFEEVIKLLKSGDEKVQKRSLELLKFDKLIYDRKDILNLEQIAKLIKDYFPVTAKYICTESKSKTGSRDKWICECGKNNKETNEYCAKCGKDVYGFERGNIKPVEISEIISNKILILKEIF